METHFVGDFNIDLRRRDPNSRRLKHLMENFGLHQMIDKPTRTVEQSKTLLYHHYCTHPEHIMFTSVPSFGLSDHNPTILVRKQNANLRRKKNGKHEWIFFRSLKKVDTNALIADLNKIPWSILDVYSDDPDEMLNTWIKLVLDVIDTHAPVKQKRVKTSVKPSWLTNEILEAVENHDSLKKQLEHGRISRDTYNNARTKVVHMVNKAKSMAIKKELEENRQNSLLLWKALKKLNRTNNAKSMPDDLKPSRHQANKFNKHFVSITSSIIDKNQLGNPDLTQIENFVNARKPSTNNFEIPLLDTNTLDKLIKSLPTNVATGLDGISVHLLELISPAVLESLTKVLNCSIQSGICPSALKLARVTPVHKSGPASDPNNFRPISVLPIMSKLLERHICTHFMLYLRSFNLIVSTQSGFRPHH